MSFKQEPFIRSFIGQCTAKRAASRSKIEESIMKFISNINFGKSIENVRERLELIIVTTQKLLVKLANQPNFIDSHIHSENVCIVKLRKRVAKLMKAYMVGFTILERAKGKQIKKIDKK